MLECTSLDSANNEIERLRKHLTTALNAVSIMWTEVADELPGKEGWYLAYDGRTVLPNTVWFDGTFSKALGSPAITHWQPLPKVPEK